MRTTRIGPALCVSSCALLGVLGAMGLMAASNAEGGPPLARAAAAPRAEPIPVTVGRLLAYRVTPHGSVGAPGAGAADACNVIANHSSLQFQVGEQANLQAGFAEDEIFAASYTVAAGEFPLKINLIETLFGGLTTITTETHWSVLVWEGTPDTGNLIAEYSSDGFKLPHVILPPAPNPGGGQASFVQLQFSIEPNDPNQIIVQDNGSHTFSVGFRIDAHHAQSGNGCQAGALPTCCNAFPVTDMTGVGAPGGNWLRGINCGPLGCPPNGGWAAFAGLVAGLCRPTGDWGLRATWSSLACTPGVGACCLPSGACEIMSSAACTTAGGTYQGDGTTCVGVSCPQPSGACCFSNGLCLNMTQASCATAQGTWLGAGSSCAPNNQCPTGACCLPSGQCKAGMTALQCQAAGGTFQGVGVACAGVNCPQPTGACCLSGGGCLVLTQSDCSIIPNASWKGAGTSCVDLNQNGIADACEAVCYPNCDGSSAGGVPTLNVNDYICFQTRFALGDPYADCDNSGSRNVNDYICFQTRFALGCR